MGNVSEQAYKKLRSMEVIDSKAVQELVFADFKPDEISKPKIKRISIRDFTPYAYPNKMIPDALNGHYMWTATVKKSKNILLWLPFSHVYYEVYNTNVKLLKNPIFDFENDWLFGFIPMFAKTRRIYCIGKFSHIDNTDKLHKALNCEASVSLYKMVDAYRCFKISRTSMRAVYDKAYVSLRLYSVMTGNRLSDEENYEMLYDKMTVENYISDVDYNNLPELYR